MATTDIIHIAGDLTPARHAMAFLGGATDDYVQVNAAAAGQLAAAFTSGTWTAWIMPQDATQTGTLISFADASVVEYLELSVKAGKVVAECCDNTTVQWVLTTDEIVTEAHKWTHITLVHDGEKPKIYIDGELVAQTLSTATTPASWISVLGGLDNGRIGAANNAGDASVIQEYGGGIGCVKLWGGITDVGALTPEQIKADFEDSLISKTPYNEWCWGHRGIMKDEGTGADDGTIVGDVVGSHGYCCFESTFREAGFVTADYPVIAITGQTAHCIVVKSA